MGFEQQLTATWLVQVRQVQVERVVWREPEPVVITRQELVTRRVVPVSQELWLKVTVKGRT